MKNKNKIVNNFLILFGIFTLIIIIGFLTLSKPEYEYKMTTSEILEEVLNDSDLLRPEKAMAIIANKHHQFRFIDLRSPFEFEKGHMETAINIPFKDLLAEEYSEILDQDEKFNVLYCSNELKAREAYLLLRQIGYKNLKILLGGYDFVTDFILDGYKTKMGTYPDDKAKYDYAKIAKETKGFNKINKTENIKPKAVVKRKRVEAEVAGGC